MKNVGLGQSYVIGIGGDYYPGTRADEALEFLLNDPDTKGIAILGEPGGSMEEDLSNYLLSLPLGSKPSKPIIGFISGLFVPPSRPYGHSGAIWRKGDGFGDPREKRRLWEKAGVRVVDTLEDLGPGMKEELRKVGVE